MMRTSWKLAALAATAVLVAQAHAQVAEDAKKVLMESADAMKKAEGISYHAKKTGTGMLKDIINAEGDVKLWRPTPGAEFWVMVDGKIKQPGGADKKQTAMFDGKVAHWLDWSDNTLKERSVSDMQATSEMNIAKQSVLEEYLSTNPFDREIKLGILTKKGVDNVNGEVCDIIEAMPPTKDRNFTWAISVKDRLPRRLEIGTGTSAQKISMITEITDLKTGVKFTEKDFTIAMPNGFVKDTKVAAAPTPTPTPVTPTPSTPAPPVELGLKAGAPAPTFTAKSVSGADVSLGGMKGNVVVLEFWGTMFKQSTAHSIEMQSLADDMKGQKVNFVGLACRELNDKAPADYWQMNKLSYPLVTNGNQIASDYKVAGFPSYYVIGPDGNIVAFFQDFPGKDRMQAAISGAMAK